MAEKQYIEMKLFSRRPLDADFAKAQLRFLATFSEGVFAPEKCDVYEPLKQKFDPADLEVPVRWLTQPGGECKFKRTRPVSIEGYIANLRFAPLQVRPTEKSEWHEFVPSVPEPVFCTRWTLWIDLAAVRKKGLDILKRFLVEAFRVAEADYAFLTTEADYKGKNFSVSRDSQGTLEEFVGDDPEKGIPGLYWMNLFGPLYVDWFGGERLKALPATVESQPGGAVFIQFGATPEEAEGIDARQSQRAAIAALGNDAFFDISCPECALRVPAAISERVMRVPE
jgi:hypothetical protein